MFNIHKKCAEKIDKLERAYSDIYSKNSELKDKITTLKFENDALKEHMTALAMICAALMDVVTEEQKKAVSKKIEIINKGKKKGKKDGKKEK